jgi:hypothetical protein
VRSVPGASSNCGFLALPEGNQDEYQGDDGQAKVSERRMRLRHQIIALSFLLAGSAETIECGEK